MANERIDPRVMACTTARAKTRVGIFRLEFSEKGLRSVCFPKSRYRLMRGRKDALRPEWRLTVQRFQRYFKDPGVSFPRVELDLNGQSSFRQKIYRSLMTVRAGTTVTYGELARRAGHPGAARAVGSAMRKNRLPIVIPCHRVLPASGGLGEYSGGKRWKRWLLEHEALFGQRATVNAQRKRSELLRFAR